MSRLRVDSTNFADNFTRPLSLTRLPTPEPNLEPDALPVVSESAETLRSLLVSLTPPVSQSSVDDALKYLAQADRDALFIEEDAQEKALKTAVVSQVAVGLYARALDVYLSEAVQIEAEAEWWANVERSRASVAWFLLQSAFFALCFSMLLTTNFQRYHRGWPACSVPFSMLCAPIVCLYDHPYSHLPRCSACCLPLHSNRPH